MPTSVFEPERIETACRQLTPRGLYPSFVLPDDGVGSRFEDEGLKAPVRGEDEAQPAQARVDRNDGRCRRAS